MQNTRQTRFILSITVTVVGFLFFSFWLLMRNLFVFFFAKNCPIYIDRQQVDRSNAALLAEPGVTEPKRTYDIVNSTFSLFDAERRKSRRLC